jgi:hypothetical protein
MSVVRLSLLAAAALVASACAKPRPIQLGPDQTLAPRLTVSDSERPPRTLTVELAEPASVVVLAVFPGRGATIVWPKDSTQTLQLARGTHRLPVDTVRLPANPDTVLFRRPPAAPRDTGRAARRQARDREIPIDTARILRALGPESAHFLVFASRVPLSYTIIRRRVEGVTIPLSPNEALNTVGKILDATLPGDAQWAAYATEVRLK